MNSIIPLIPPFRTGYLFPHFPLANFDGVHYLAIAEHGYINNIRFMPLYPLLIRSVKTVFPFIPLHLIGFMLSLLFLICSCIYLYKLFRLDYSAHQTQKALFFLLLLPTSFFFWSVYSESLFLFLTVASLYYARKKNWALAVLFGFFSSLTRIVGFLICIPLFIEYVKVKNKNIQTSIFIFISSLGLPLYALYNYLMWKNPFLFLQAHSQLSNGRSSEKLILFPQTMYRYVKMLATVDPPLWEWKIALLELATFIVVCVCVYLLWRQKGRLSYIVYIILALLIPASSGTFTGLPRYSIVLFPLLLVFSRIKNRIILISILISFFILQLVLFLYFSRGYYIA